MASDRLAILSANGGARMPSSQVATSLGSIETLLSVSSRKTSTNAGLPLFDSTASSSNTGDCWMNDTHGLYLQKKSLPEMGLARTLRHSSQVTGNRKEEERRLERWQREEHNEPVPWGFSGNPFYMPKAWTFSKEKCPWVGLMRSDKSKDSIILGISGLLYLTRMLSSH